MSVWVWVGDGSAGTDAELKTAAAWLSHTRSSGLSSVSGFFFSSNSTSVGCLITQREKADIALCSKRINTGGGFWHLLIWLSSKLNEKLHHFHCISSDFWEAEAAFALSAHKQKKPLPLWLAGSSLYLLHFKHFWKVFVCPYEGTYLKGSKMACVQQRLLQEEDFLSAASCGWAV